MLANAHKDHSIPLMFASDFFRDNLKRCISGRTWRLKINRHCKKQYSKGRGEPVALNRIDANFCIYLMLVLETMLKCCTNADTDM